VAFLASVAVLTTVVLLVVPSRYTARVSLVPESRSGLPAGQIAGLAALAGINLPAGASGPVGQTPQFYASLLTSRPILYAVLQRRYPTDGLGGHLARQDSAPLTEILRAPGDTPERRLWNGAKRLAARVSVRTDIRTGILTLTFDHTSPALSAAVAAAFVQELERFNLEARQSQAGARRRFVERRLVSASTDLEEAEAALRNFLTRNRRYEESPSLRFEYGRLERSLTVQQELYLQLRRELDAARIAEVDDLPAITVVEPALVPQRRSGPARRKWLAAVLVVAFGLQAGWYILADHHARLAPGLVTGLEALAPQLAARLRARARAAAA